jgi:hypothetical protein
MARTGMKFMILVLAWRRAGSNTVNGAGAPVLTMVAPVRACFKAICWQAAFGLP